MRFKYLTRNDKLYLEMHISRLCQLIDMRAKSLAMLNSAESEITECQQKIYELLYGKMMGVCLRYSNNREEAKDLLHDGFLKVFDNVGKFNFS